MGISVRELVREFSRVSGRAIPCEQVERRVGDVDSLVCDGARARLELHWAPSRDITTMCKYPQLTYRLCRQMFNLGTGKGVSVLQLLRTFEAVTKTTVAFNIEARREGDIVSMFANTSLALQELGWEAKYNLEQMCKSI